MFQDGVGLRQAEVPIENIRKIRERNSLTAASTCARACVCVVCVCVVSVVVVCVRGMSRGRGINAP